jgi:hypothetical protein
MCDCLNSTAPPHTIPKRKYSVTKRKEKRKAVTLTEYDKNMVPYQVVIEPSYTVSIADTNGIMKLIIDYIHYVYPKSKTFKRISSEGKYRVGIGYIPSSNKGMSDAEGMVNGKFLNVRLKMISIPFAGSYRFHTPKPKGWMTT